MFLLCTVQKYEYRINKQVKTEDVILSRNGGKSDPPSFRSWLLKCPKLYWTCDKRGLKRPPNSPQGESSLQ